MINKTTDIGMPEPWRMYTTNGSTRSPAIHMRALL